MFSPDINNFQSWMRYLLQCPVCEAKYRNREIRVITSDQSLEGELSRALLHVDCPKCHSSMVFNVNVSGKDVCAIGSVTDLTGFDTQRFQSSKPLSVDDCIELHNTLDKLGDTLVDYLATHSSVAQQSPSQVRPARRKADSAVSSKSTKSSAKVAIKSPKKSILAPKVSRSGRLPKSQQSDKI